MNPSRISVAIYSLDVSNIWNEFGRNLMSFLYWRGCLVPAVIRLHSKPKNSALHHRLETIWMSNIDPHMMYPVLIYNWLWRHSLSWVFFSGQEETLHRAVIAFWWRTSERTMIHFWSYWFFSPVKVVIYMSIAFLKYMYQTYLTV